MERQMVQQLALGKAPLLDEVLVWLRGKELDQGLEFQKEQGKARNWEFGMGLEMASKLGIVVLASPTLYQCWIVNCNHKQC
jgi:hypothetical protein